MLDKANNEIDSLREQLAQSDIKAEKLREIANTASRNDPNESIASRLQKKLIQSYDPPTDHFTKDRRVSPDISRNTPDVDNAGSRPGSA